MLRLEVLRCAPARPHGHRQPPQPSAADRARGAHPRRRLGDARARGEPARRRRRPLRQDRAEHQRGRRPRRRARPTWRRSRTRRGVKAADGPFALIGVRVRSRPTNFNLVLEGRRRAAAAHRPPEADRRALAVGRAGRGRPRARRRARSRRARRPARWRSILHGRRASLTVVGIAVLGRPRPLVGARSRPWPPSRRAASARPRPRAPARRPRRERRLRRRPAPALPARPADGVRLARRPPGGHRPHLDRRRSSSAPRASPRCSRSASSSPTPSAGGSSPRGATSAC